MLSLLVGQEGLPGVMFAIEDVFWQVLVLALWQEKDADDADEGAAGKDDVVKEVAFLVVQLYDRGGQHSEASAGQDQAQASAPAQGTGDKGRSFRRRAVFGLYEEPVWQTCSLFGRIGPPTSTLTPSNTSGSLASPGSNTESCLAFKALVFIQLVLPSTSLQFRDTELLAVPHLQSLGFHYQLLQA